jgi:23S rRNA (cytosine1962-C5)-methyltransferase
MSAPGRIILKPRKARPFFARHPWVFDSSIDRIKGEPKTGDEVKVEASDGQPIAVGLYNPESAIRVRLYRWDGGTLDEAFWASQIASALRLRQNVLKLGGPDASAYRLIFSEGDGLSGLTVDRYDRWLVVQITSLALYERREMLLRLLQEATGAEGMVVRTERGIAAKEGLKLGEESVFGTVPESAIEIVENGLKFHADLHAGQKTGFYCDQRLNRKAAAEYCNGQRVLDLFCFTGGFSDRHRTRPRTRPAQRHRPREGRVRVRRCPQGYRPPALRREAIRRDHL